MNRVESGVRPRADRRPHRWGRISTVGAERARELTQPQPYCGPPKRRCTCGVCRDCVDNARWERVFAEKFADPDYYRRPPVSFSSPLSGF